MKHCLILALIVGSGWADTAAIRPRILVVTGLSDLPHHHWEQTTPPIRALLAGRFDVRVNEEPRGIAAASLEGYSAIVLNYNGPRWTAAAEQAVESFVRGGGGLVAFHQSSYGEFFGMQLRGGKWVDGPDRGWSAFAGMIGARWKAENLGHARRWPFVVEWKNPAHPVAQGLAPSFTANDELYHKLDLASGVDVLADALSPADLGGTGKREPLIWTNRYGEGRVFFTTLGHDAMAFYQPGMITAFARGVEWAATGMVAPEPPQKAAPVRLLVVTSGHAYSVSFYAMLDSLGVRWTHAATHEEAFAKPLEDRFDVVLLHDMLDSASPAARERLKAFVEAGRGVISLHHSIVDYTDWPWWYEQVTGGKYFIKPANGHPASRNRGGIELMVTPVRGKERHPVLRGVGPLVVQEEVYRDMYLSSKINVLMETAHPENDRPVVYVGPHEKARVLYVQLGHSEHTMDHPGFRRLMSNAVRWTARREE